MKKKKCSHLINKAIAAILSLALFSTCSFVYSMAMSTYIINGSVMTNEYLSLSVNNSNGRFTIGTTEGNPESNTDNNKKMLFGWPDTGTSYTTIVIDGNEYIYGNSGFSDNPTFDVSNGMNSSTAIYGDISVRQILKVINNNSTDKEDVVEIKYEVTNNGTVSHNYGTRIMLDTMLGNNDHAPFRIPDVGSVTTQTEFTGSDIPQYWQAFDSLTDPNVIAQGSFLRSSTNKPDKVQFTNWEKVYDNCWECPISAGSDNGDSAVTITWYSKSINPGETKTYVTHYGLSELVQDLKPPLAVSLYGDSTVSISNGSYSPNPLKLTAYIQNIGNGDARNVKAALLIGDGNALSVNGSDYISKNIGTLTPGQEYQCSWNININSISEDTVQLVGIRLTADGLEDKTLFKYITIPAIGKDNRILWGKEKLLGGWSGQDNLSFINTYDSFLKHSGFLGLGSGWKDNYYHISDEYFSMLTNGMSNTVWSYMDERRNDSWRGSCYGMSCVISLMKDGRLTPKYYKSRAKNTHDLNAPVKNDKVENLVNFYHLMQFLPDVCDEVDNFDAMGQNESIVLENLIHETQKVKSGGLPVVVGFCWLKNEIDPKTGNHVGAGHAVVAYDVDEGTYSVNNQNYHYRVSICDPNKSKWTYMYISEDFERWQYDGLNTTGDGAASSVWIDNGVEQKVLSSAYSSVNLIDVINPETGVNRTLLKNYNSNFISDYTESSGISIYDNNGKLLNNLDTKFSLDGTIKQSYLPQGQEYTIVPNSDNKDMDCSIILQDSSFSVNSTRTDSVNVKSDGSVQFNGNNSECEITLTLNENIQTMNCFRFNFSGNNIDDYRVRSVDEGIIVEGSNLSNTTIVANNRNGNLKVNVSTTESSVLLSDIDEVTIGVYVDNNHDGVYETIIAQSESFNNKHSKSFWECLIEFFEKIFFLIVNIFS